MRKTLAALSLFFMSFIVCAGSNAQTRDELELRSAFETLLREQSRTWYFSTYEFNSVGYPVYTEYARDGSAAVLAAGFRYTNGRTDTVYVAIDRTRRTCLSYASESGPCPLFPRSYNTSASPRTAPSLSGGDILIGALIIGAILSGGGSSSSSDSDYQRYEENCRAQGLTPGNC